MMSYYITPLPKTILSAITFPITWPLDRTLYLSYFSDNRVTYYVFFIFNNFFAIISGSTGPILLTLKTILSATKFPIILVIVIFSVSVIFLEIFSKNNDLS